LKIGADFLPRLWSALILAPLVLFAAVWGSGPFLLLIGIAAVLVLWEWTTITGGQPKATLIGLGSVSLIAALIEIELGVPVAAIGAILLGVAAAFFVATGGASARLWALFGVLYAAGLAIPALILRDDPMLGLASLVWLFAVVWSTDIAAYFCGRLIGGPKLWPRVSPNKTWSGAIGGSLFATLAGMLTVHLFGIDCALYAAPAAFAASVASQGGDLFESSMKRRFGVKDSSHLIPGHGGLMDRLDGFITAAVLALVIGLVRNPGAPAQGLLLW